MLQLTDFIVRRMTISSPVNTPISGKAGSDVGRPGNCQDAIDTTILASDKVFKSTVQKSNLAPDIHKRKLSFFPTAHNLLKTSPSSHSISSARILVIIFYCIWELLPGIFPFSITTRGPNAMSHRQFRY